MAALFATARRHGGSMLQHTRMPAQRGGSAKVKAIRRRQSAMRMLVFVGSASRKRAAEPLHTARDARQISDICHYHDIQTTGISQIRHVTSFIRTPVNLHTVLQLMALAVNNNSESPSAHCLRHH